MIFVRLAGFMGWYAKQLLRSYWRMLRDIAGSGRGVTPAVVRVDTTCAQEFEVGLLGILLAMTPGTLVLDTRAHAPGARDGTPWTLYVHGFHEADPEDLRADVVEMEHRLLTALGRTGAGGTGGAR